MKFLPPAACLDPAVNRTYPGRDREIQSFNKKKTTIQHCTVHLPIYLTIYAVHVPQPWPLQLEGLCSDLKAWQRTEPRFIYFNCAVKRLHEEKLC